MKILKTPFSTEKLMFKLSNKIASTLLASSILLSISGCQAAAGMHDKAYLYSTTASAATTDLNSESAQQQKFEQHVTYQQMLAPIALYPDSLLTHIFIAATYPVDVVEATRWNTERLASNRASQRSIDYQQVMDDTAWDANVIALLEFPQILEEMNNDLRWTQSLGEAFINDEAQLLDAVQILRHKAKNAGQLAQLDNLNIVYEKDAIVIQPAQTQIVFVPSYDTSVIYGKWYWHNRPPVQWHARYHHVKDTKLSWNKGVHITFDFFFNAFHWRNKYVVVSSRVNSRYYRAPKRILTHKQSKRWQHVVKHSRVLNSQGKHGSHVAVKPSHRIKQVSPKPVIHKKSHSRDNFKAKQYRHSNTSAKKSNSNNFNRVTNPVSNPVARVNNNGRKVTSSKENRSRFVSSKGSPRASSTSTRERQGGR